MNKKQQNWLALKNEVMNKLEEQYGVMEAIREWEQVYRPLIVESLSKPGTYTLSIGVTYTVKDKE